MSIMQKFFGSKSVAITSTMILNEINRSEGEIGALHAKAGEAMAEVATMTDAQHVEAEAGIAATKRAIGRLDRRVAHLSDELPKVIATEEAAAKTAADEALRQRAEAARKANTKEAEKLLAEYNKLASAIGDINGRLAEIVAETNSVNAELLRNPVAEHVVLYVVVHRKHPDQEAAEHREMREVWEHHDGTQTEVKRDETGTLIRPSRTFDRVFGYYPEPKLERREVVIRRTSHRPGHYESSLSSLHLPPGFAGGASHWPRK
jgi:hypothetical protein